MPAKSIHKSKYSVLLHHLHALRTTVGLPQVDLRAALQRPQLYVSDVERGSRRMDLLQLRELCNACGSSLTEFVNKFEQELEEARPNRRPPKQPSR